VESRRRIRLGLEEADIRLWLAEGRTAEALLGLAHLAGCAPEHVGLLEPEADPQGDRLERPPLRARTLRLPAPQQGSCAIRARNSRSPRSRCCRSGCRTGTASPAGSTPEVGEPEERLGGPALGEPEADVGLLEPEADPQGDIRLWLAEGRTAEALLGLAHLAGCAPERAESTYRGRSGSRRRSRAARWVGRRPGRASSPRARPSRSCIRGPDRRGAPRARPPRRLRARAGRVDLSRAKPGRDGGAGVLGRQGGSGARAQEGAEGGEPQARRAHEPLRDGTHRPA
jgi:hypothetical protein